MVCTKNCSEFMCLRFMTSISLAHNIWLMTKKHVGFWRLCKAIKMIYVGGYSYISITFLEIWREPGKLTENLNSLLRCCNIECEHGAWRLYYSLSSLVLWWVEWWRFFSKGFYSPFWSQAICWVPMKLTSFMWIVDGIIFANIIR